MVVECHVCYELLVPEQRTLALDCGHVCCAPCLERWLQTSQGNQCKQCPFCRFTPPRGSQVVPRPIFLKFVDSDNVPSSRTVLKLDDAAQTAGALQTLLQGFSRAQDLSRQDVRGMLDEADKLNTALQDLYHIRELQDVMADISSTLTTIRDNLPSKVKLEIAERKLRESNASGDALKRQLELKEHQVGIFKDALDGAMQAHKTELDELRAQFSAERSVLEDEISESRRQASIYHKSAEEIRENAHTPKPSYKFGSTRGSGEKDADVDDYATNDWAADGHEDRGTRGVGRIPTSYSMAVRANIAPSVDHAAISRRCAEAFVYYYCDQHSIEPIEVEIISEKTDGARRRARASFQGRTISAHGSSARVARGACYQEICGSLLETDRTMWEEFVNSPLGERFSY